MKKDIEELKKSILHKFQNLEAILDYDNNEKAYYIVIDDMDVYHSSKFSSFVFEKKLELMRNKKIVNIFVICDPTRFQESFEYQIYEISGKDNSSITHLQPPMDIGFDDYQTGNQLVMAA